MKKLEEYLTNEQLRELDIQAIDFIQAWKDELPGTPFKFTRDELFVVFSIKELRQYYINSKEVLNYTSKEFPFVKFMTSSVQESTEIPITLFMENFESLKKKRVFLDLDMKTGLRIPS